MMMGGIATFTEFVDLGGGTLEIGDTRVVVDGRPTSRTETREHPEGTINLWLRRPAD
jgi:hypothetical protein